MSSPCHLHDIFEVCVISSERLGVVSEHIDAEGLADDEQLLCVDRGFVEEFLEGARGDAYVCGEPGVGVPLAAQFVADKVAYVYLHGGWRLRVCISHSLAVTP